MLNRHVFVTHTPARVCLTVERFVYLDCVPFEEPYWLGFRFGFGCVSFSSLISFVACAFIALGKVPLTLVSRHTEFDIVEC